MCACVKLSRIYKYDTVTFYMYICVIISPAGRIQVTTPVDREEEERQNQRMYWPAEGFVTRTSEAVGEFPTLQNVFTYSDLALHVRDVVNSHVNLCFFSPKTLGHLEKAVVLELTLKHLNALTAVTEQQHQKIIALQNGKMNKTLS